MKNLALTFGIAATVFFTASCNNDDILEGCTPETPKATTESNVNPENYVQNDYLNIFDRDDYIGPEKYTDLKLSFADECYKPVQTRGLTGNTLVDWMLEKVLAPAGTSAGKAAWGELCKTLFKSKEQETLDNILKKSEEVKEKTETMISLFQNTTYESYLNLRKNKYINTMNNNTVEAYEHIVACCKGDSINMDDIKKYVNDWAKYKKMDGDKPETHWMNFVDFLTENKVDQKNIYQMYDAYVFNTYPFEHCGYPMRESLRNMDESVIIQNAMLTLLYYKLNYSGNMAERRINNVYNVIKKYKDFAEKNKIEYHYDKVICQIKGAHFYFDKSLHMISLQETDNKDVEQMWELNYSRKFNTLSLTEKEMTAIANYYKGNQNFANLMEVFVKEGGMVNPFEGQTSYNGSRLISSEGFALNNMDDITDVHLGKDLVNRELSFKSCLNLWKNLNEELIDKDIKFGKYCVLLDKIRRFECDKTQENANFFYPCGLVRENDK